MRGFSAFQAARSQLLSTGIGRAFLFGAGAVLILGGVLFATGPAYLGVPVVAAVLCLLVIAAPRVDRFARRRDTAARR